MVGTLIKGGSVIIAWHICGTLNPKAGTYSTIQSPQVIAVFEELMSKYAGPPDCEIRNVLASGESVVAAIFYRAIAKNGWHLEQELCWVLKYQGGVCVAVR